MRVDRRQSWCPSTDLKCSVLMHVYVIVVGLGMVVCDVSARAMRLSSPYRFLSFQKLQISSAARSL